MEITEVRIKLMEKSDDRLQAFCSITFDDCFVVRDLKIIEGSSGRPFVAMPSRKLTAHCPACGSKNHLRAEFCNQCGEKLKDDRSTRDQDGRFKLYADIAHPINSACREMIQERVITEYESERERASEPGYMSRYDDDYTSDEGPDADFEEQSSSDRDTNRQRPDQQEADETEADDKQSQRQESLSERAQVQPPEKQPRPPHKPPASKQQSSGAARRQQRGNQDFGAGIF
ncbi:MAG: septation protein SpoVG family protein [Pirellulaceae bacterium]